MDGTRRCLDCNAELPDVSAILGHECPQQRLMRAIASMDVHSSPPPLTFLHAELQLALASCTLTGTNRPTRETTMSTTTTIAQQAAEAVAAHLRDGWTFTELQELALNLDCGLSVNAEGYPVEDDAVAAWVTEGKVVTFRGDVDDPEFQEWGEAPIPS